MEPHGKYMEDEIRKAFKRSGMTIYRLAKNSGVCQPVVSRAGDCARAGAEAQEPEDQS